MDDKGLLYTVSLFCIWFYFVERYIRYSAFQYSSCGWRNFFSSRFHPYRSSLISKMAYEKSIINININFDNEDQPVPHLPKPFLPRKDRGKDKIATIQPSPEAQRTGTEIQRRVMELQKFRRESQSAVEAPLLVTALIKKTHQRLDNIEVSPL